MSNKNGTVVIRVRVRLEPGEDGTQCILRLRDVLSEGLVDAAIMGFAPHCETCGTHHVGDCRGSR